MFPYSNSVSRSECTADEAYRWSKGKAVFASGSSFPPVHLDGKTFIPHQGNDGYIFSTMGIAVYATQAKRVTDAMFIVAAKAVAEQVSNESLATGLNYRPQSKILAASLHVVVKTAEHMFEKNLTRVDRPADIEEHIRALAYHAEYRD